jgi:hemoglobin/transferrin/lactoferrin receptor protein
MKIGGGYTKMALACAAGLGTALSGAALAADSTAGEQAKLETVVVTAIRLEKPLNEVARSIAVVGLEELLSIQPQSVPGALAYEPNITVAGGPRAANQTVNVRGLEGSKVLQTVDGARQGFESGHRPSYFLDPELVRSVEAVRGPASSAWGSGAVGGVVAQNTITADDLVSDAGALGGFVKGGYNDSNSGATSTAALAGKGEQLGWLVSGYYRDSDDFEMGNGKDLLGSGSDSYGAMGKLNWELAEGQDLELIYRASEWDGHVPSNATAEISGTSNFMIGREQSTDNLNLSYRLDDASDLLNLEARLYQNRVDMEEMRLSDGRPDRTELDTIGFNLTNLSEFGGTRLFYGIDIYREDFEAKRGGDSRPTPPDAETNVWSAYALAEIPLAAKWGLEVGLRYDDFETEATNLGETSSDSATSPSAAIVWDAADWLVLSLRHDRAFRAPGAEELYSTGYHFCMGPGFCNGFQPNPDLDPEQAANTELNAKMAFADVAGADVIHVEASVFENQVDDFIEQVVVGPSFVPFPDPGYTTWFNVDDASLQGGEIVATYLRGGLSLKAAYGQVRGEDDDTGEDLSNIPADTWKLDAGYRFDALNLVTGLRYTYADEQDRTDNEENVSGTIYDSYGITDLYASWQPAALAGLRFDLNINNLEGKHYRQAWQQLYEPGREVILSARYQF